MDVTASVTATYDREADFVEIVVDVGTEEMLTPQLVRHGRVSFLTAAGTKTGDPIFFSRMFDSADGAFILSLNRPTRVYPRVLVELTLTTQVELSAVGEVLAKDEPAFTTQQHATVGPNNQLPSEV